MGIIQEVNEKSVLRFAYRGAPRFRNFIMDDLAVRFQMEETYGKNGAEVPLATAEVTNVFDLPAGRGMDIPRAAFWFASLLATH
jgi:hypothetical protein